MTEQTQGSTEATSTPAPTVAADVPAVKDTSAAVNLISQLANDAAVAAETADPHELMLSAITDIANAATVDDLFAANETGGIPSLRDSEELWNVPLSVFDVSFVKSSDEYSESGLGTFAIVWATTDTGKEVNFNTGASNVVATLFKAQHMGTCSAANPWRVIFTAKKTANGTLLRVGKPKI